MLVTVVRSLLFSDFLMVIISALNVGRRNMSNNPTKITMTRREYVFIGTFLLVFGWFIGVMT